MLQWSRRLEGVVAKNITDHDTIGFHSASVHSLYPLPPLEYLAFAFTVITVLLDLYIYNGTIVKVKAYPMLMLLDGT